MGLLPGLDDELIENILAYREIEDIQDRAEIGGIVPFENMQELSAWVGNNTSNIYSIFIYREIEIENADYLEMREEDEFANPDPATQSYMEIVEVRNYNNLPRIYKIDPYGRLPDTAPPRVAEADYLFQY